LDAKLAPGSALNDPEVRKSMMENAMDRRTFDDALHYVYTYIAVSSLAEMFNIGDSRQLNI
jgi:hypothetical protein